MDTKLINNRLPQACSIQIVDSCFLRCKMCFAWQRQGQDELSISEWKAFIVSLTDIVYPAGFVISFTGGGEPLYRKGIVELIRFTAEKGFTPQLTSNGYLLTAEMVRALTEAGLGGISISLDSLNSATHDFLRGQEGVFKRVMEAIGFLRASPMKISIATTIMDGNLYDLVDLVKWVHQDGICGIRFQAIEKPFAKELDERWFEVPELKFLWPQEMSEVAAVIDELITLKQQGYPVHNPIGQLELFKAYFQNPLQPLRLHVCNCGDFVINLDKAGNVLPCSIIGSLGNIRKQHIRDIWFSENAQKMREKIYHCQYGCHSLINCFYE